MTVESLAMSTVKLLADQVKHLTSCQIASAFQVNVVASGLGGLLYPPEGLPM